MENLTFGEDVKFRKGPAVSPIWIHHQPAEFVYLHSTANLVAAVLFLPPIVKPAFDLRVQRVAKCQGSLGTPGLVRDILLLGQEDSGDGLGPGQPAAQGPSGVLAHRTEGVPHRG